MKFAENMVILIGNLASEPREFQAAKGKGVGATLAIKRNAMDEFADFIDFAVYGEEGKKLLKLGHKGTNVGIIGRIQTKKVEKNEKKYTYLSVVAERVTVYNKAKKKTEADEYNEASDDLPF